MKRTKIVVLLILTALLLSGCTTFNNFREAFFPDGKPSDTIKIGILEPQTGGDSDKGELEIRGIQLAHDLVPQVLGKNILERIPGDLTPAFPWVDLFACKLAKLRSVQEYRLAILVGCHQGAGAMGAVLIINKQSVAPVPSTGGEELIELLCSGLHFVSSLSSQFNTHRSTGKKARKNVNFL